MPVKTVDAAVGVTSLGSAYVAGVGIGPDNCVTPSFLEMPLGFINGYSFTIDNAFSSLAAIATVVTTAYFINKFRN